MTMVCFDVEGTRFNYRVAGIALRDNQVLLNRFESQDYWFLPGGRVEMGETSREGLRREMQEELQEEVQVGQLLWIIESFFGDVEEKSYHELGLYYRMDFASESPVHRTMETFVQAGGGIDVVIGETLERRWGAKISKRGHYRDSALSSRERSVSSPGLRWTVMAVVVTQPWT